MPMGRDVPDYQSPPVTSSLIAPATGRGWRRGPSAANRPIRDSSLWFIPTAPAHWDLTDGSADDDIFSIFKISPDSRSIAYVAIKTVGDVRQSRLYIAEIESTRTREVPVKFDPGTYAGVCWSPDGSRLALNLFDDQTKESSIELVNLDGSALRKVPLPPGRWNLHVCDWKQLTPGLRAHSADQPPDPTTTRGRYRTLVEEYKNASKAYDQAQQCPERGRATASRPRTVPPFPGVHRPIPGDRRGGTHGTGFHRRAHLDRPQRL